MSEELFRPSESEDDGYDDLDDSPFKEDIRKQSMECMDAFFVDKKYWAGGKIPNSKLYTEENILTVMSTRVIDALDVAYLCLEDQAPQSWDTQMDRWSEQLCYGVLQECPRRFIPKRYAGGILLVYLAICQGVDYIDVLKEYHTQLHGAFSRAI